MSTSKYLSALMLAALIACSNSGSNDKQADTKDSVAATVNKDGSLAAMTDYAKTLPLDKIKLPDGFKISVFAEVDNARQMAISPSGIIYVGNRDHDKVYAVKDTDGDFKADQKWVIASKLNMPNGVAFKDGDLYVAEVSRIIKF